MKHTIVLCSSNRPMQEGTKHSVQAAVRAGALYMVQNGCADVALARNLALSAALEALGRLGDAPAEERRDTVLMVDDDMLFTVEQAQELIDHARATGVAASAMYATTAGTLAATRVKQADPSERQRWYTGLGLMAIPAWSLIALAEQSERFKIWDKTEYTGFTSSSAMGGEYWSEDYTLCRRLGGVHLLPVGVGHLKTIPIYPDEETIAAIRENRRLPSEPNPRVLEHIEDPKMVAANRREVH